MAAPAVVSPRGQVPPRVPPTPGPGPQPGRPLSPGPSAPSHGPPLHAAHQPRAPFGVPRPDTYAGPTHDEWAGANTAQFRPVVPQASTKPTSQQPPQPPRPLQPPHTQPPAPGHPRPASPAPMPLGVPRSPLPSHHPAVPSSSPPSASGLQPLRVPLAQQVQRAPPRQPGSTPLNQLVAPPRLQVAPARPISASDSPPLARNASSPALAHSPRAPSNPVEPPSRYRPANYSSPASSSDQLNALISPRAQQGPSSSPLYGAPSAAIRLTPIASPAPPPSAYDATPLSAPPPPPPPADPSRPSQAGFDEIDSALAHFLTNTKPEKLGSLNLSSSSPTPSQLSNPPSYPPSLPPSGPPRRPPGAPSPTPHAPPSPSLHPPPSNHSPSPSPPTQAISASPSSAPPPRPPAPALPSSPSLDPTEPRRRRSRSVPTLRGPEAVPPPAAAPTRGAKPILTALQQAKKIKHEERTFQGDLLADPASFVIEAYQMQKQRKKVIYKIACSMGGVAWTIFRTFGRLVKLSRLLNKHDLGIPLLESRRLKNKADKLDPEFVAARRLELQTWLDTLGTVRRDIFRDEKVANEFAHAMGPTQLGDLKAPDFAFPFAVFHA